MREPELSGWGRATRTRPHRVVRPSSVSELAAELGSGHDTAIARGLGRSYGDQATLAGGTVLDMTEQRGNPSNAVVAPDGLVELSAGISLDSVLRAVVPNGWFLPVVPGTRHVTVGGALAADIHGKNHHCDGTIGVHVERLTLVTGDGDIRQLQRERDADQFWATVGGLGLTGVIASASVRLMPITTGRVLVDTTRFDSVDPLLAAMVEADETARFSVAWIDLATARARGRSVLTTGRFAEHTELSAVEDPLHYAPTKLAEAPRWVPPGLLRRPTVAAFNEAWFRRAPRARRDEVQTIGRFFHPLDAIGGWNRLYGPHGFLQWQVVVPDGAEAVLRGCVERLAGSPAPCFLAVLKRFGPANPGPLSFPLQGWTLAADLPALAPGVPELLDELDRSVAGAGGRVYLAKDARLDPRLVPEMYPRLDEWRAVRSQLDPQHRFQSDLSRRLGL